jgi:hypothetical protein
LIVLVLVCNTTRKYFDFVTVTIIIIIILREVFPHGGWFKVVDDK